MRVWKPVVRSTSGFGFIMGGGRSIYLIINTANRTLMQVEFEYHPGHTGCLVEPVRKWTISGPAFIHQALRWRAEFWAEWNLFRCQRNTSRPSGNILHPPLASILWDRIPWQ